MKKTGIRKLLFCCIGAMLLLALLPAQAFAAKASIKLNKSKVNVAADGTVRLKATVTGKDSKVTWESSDKSVAVVNSKGKVTAKKKGRVTITASANGKTAQCIVTVKKKSADYKAPYKAFLEKGVTGGGRANWYCVLDIDGKDAPELIVTSDGGRFATYYVYTVKNGEVISLGDYFAFEVPSNPPVIKYVKKQKGIMTEESTDSVGGIWNNLYKISGSKIAVSYRIRRTSNPSVAYYAGKTAMTEKKVSKAAYTSARKKYFGGSKKYTMLSNTAANRQASFG